MFNFLGSLQKTFTNHSSPLTEVDEKIDCPKPIENNITTKKPLEGITLNASLFAVTGKLVGYAKIVSSVAQERVEKLSTFVNEQTFIGDLERENENFKQCLLNKKSSEGKTKLFPWDEMPNVDIARKLILTLSLDERNFLADSPLVTEDDLDFDQKAVAQELLKIDEKLQKMRYVLVPKKVCEKKFWNNYFYRVSLVKKLLIEKSKNQSHENLCTDNQPSSLGVSPLADEDWEKELINVISEFELVDKGSNVNSDVEWEEEFKALLEAETEAETTKESNVEKTGT